MHELQRARAACLTGAQVTPKSAVTHIGRQAIVIAVSLGIGVAAAGGSDSARAEDQSTCPGVGVTILHETQAELDMACRALADVTEYFQQIGFNVAPRGSVRFADRPADRATSRVHGYFDARQLQTVVYRMPDVNPWGLPWTAQLAGSFLRHEVVHMAIWEIVDQERDRLRPEWHEFIAYAVQLDLMNPQLREDVLAAGAQVQAFEHLDEVNEFTSRMAPDVFAVGAYKTYIARGSGRFVAMLLRGELVPPTFSYPFPVLPGQIPQR